MVKRQYSQSDRLALTLIDTMDGSPVGVATINVPETNLKPNEVVIKDYSENEGLLDVLVSAGIVIPTGRVITLPRGTKAPICNVLI